VRPTLLAAIFGLLFLLMAIGVPQQVSAAGKFDGEWKGKFFCEISIEDPFHSNPLTITNHHHCLVLSYLC